MLNIAHFPDFPTLNFQDLEDLESNLESKPPFDEKAFAPLIPFIPKEMRSKFQWDCTPPCRILPNSFSPITKKPDTIILCDHPTKIPPHSPAVVLSPSFPKIQSMKPVATTATKPTKIKAPHFQFGYTPSPLYPLTALSDIKESWNWFQYNRAHHHTVRSISTGISLFGKSLHIAFAISYIADAILLGLKISFGWAKTLIPVLGICVSGIELIKEILDTGYIYNTSKKINELIHCLSEKIPQLKATLERDLAYQKILGKKIIRIILDEIDQGEKKDIQKIEDLLKIQLKKIKIVHGISIACLALTVASFLTTMILTPYTLFFGISASYTAISFIRTALLQCYLYEPGHKFVARKMVPPLIRKRIFPMVKRCFGQSSSSRSSSTPSQTISQPASSPISSSPSSPS